MRAAPPTVAPAASPGRDRAAARAAAIHSAGPLVGVAFSGGRDSTALLHSTLRCAAEQGLQVLAMHVNHGLLPQADQWQQTLQRRCAAWARRGAPLRLLCERISEKPAAGASVEAWARVQRYRALRRMALAAGCDTVLLAHHRQDQAETFLLQALRGAGVAGLAAMPAASWRDGICWMRPWLAQPREAIEAYVARHRLSFIDDPSNADPRFSRNRLRQQVWPLLLQAFPQAGQVLGDAARRVSDASQCLQELAAIDIDHVADGNTLLLERWLVLSPARRRNMLRAWLQHMAGRAPPASLVERLHEQWPADAEDGDAAIRGGRFWDWAGDRLLAGGGGLSFLADAARREAAQTMPRPGHPCRLAIDRPGPYRFAAWAGSLLVEPVASGGIELARLATVELRPRQGGEQFQAGPRRPPRSLKKQFQASDVPAWQRDGPLLFAADRLIFVAGLGIDARCLVERGDCLVTLAWQADDPG